MCQNMRSEALNWKAEHETLLSKYSDVQKQLAAALTREAMLQAELAEARRVHKVGWLLCRCRGEVVNQSFGLLTPARIACQSLELLV